MSREYIEVIDAETGIGILADVRWCEILADVVVTMAKRDVLAASYENGMAVRDVREVGRDER